MMTYELELMYDEYCMDCACEEIEPMSMAEWMDKEVKDGE